MMGIDRSVRISAAEPEPGPKGEECLDVGPDGEWVERYECRADAASS